MKLLNILFLFHEFQTTYPICLKDIYLTLTATQVLVGTPGAEQLFVLNTDILFLV